MINVTMNDETVKVSVNGNLKTLMNDTLNIVKGIRNGIADKDPMSAEIYSLIMKRAFDDFFEGNLDADDNEEEIEEKDPMSEILDVLRKLTNEL